MKKRDDKPRTMSTKRRLVLGFMGLVILAMGVASLMAGRLLYPNSRGELAFTPFAIVVGAMVIAAAIFMRRD